MHLQKLLVFCFHSYSSSVRKIVSRGGTEDGVSKELSQVSSMIPCGCFNASFDEVKFYDNDAA